MERGDDEAGLVEAASREHPNKNQDPLHSSAEIQTASATVKPFSRVQSKTRDMRRFSPPRARQETTALLGEWVTR